MDRKLPPDIAAVVERSLTPAELADAGDDDVALAALVISRAILPAPRRYTMAEAAALAGVPTEQAARLWRALGLPDPGGQPLFTDIDVAALADVVHHATERDELEMAIEQTRVIGGALATVAEVNTDRFVLLAQRLLEEQADGIEAAQQLLECLDVDRMANLLVYVYRRQLLAAIQRRMSWAGGGPLDAAELTVGFADLTGFTSLSQQLDVEDLTELLRRFEAVTQDAIVARGGRVVKTIGDEVMFVCPSPTTAAETALALVDNVAADGMLPPLRVGLDHGPVLLRDGDVFGATVNRASRLVDLARPGTVVVPSSVRDALEGLPGIRLRALGVRRIKDVGMTWLWSVTRDPGIRS